MASLSPALAYEPEASGLFTLGAYQWVTTGTSSNGDRLLCVFARRVYPLQEWDGRVPARKGAEILAATPPSQVPDLTGLIITHKGEQYVLGEQIIIQPKREPSTTGRPYAKPADKPAPAAVKPKPTKPVTTQESLF
jgi:hypothetical protein